MNCTRPQFKVYKDDLGRISVNGSVAAPSQWGYTPYSQGDQYPENDRISLTSGAAKGFTDKYPYQVYRQNGTQVGDLAAVVAYFDSLGIGQPDTPDLSGYVPRDEFDAAIIALYAAMGETPPTPTLATPQPVASNVSDTAITISFPAIPFATSYEYRRNGTLVYTGSEATRTFNGLAPNTQYTFSVIAKANNYLNSNTGSVTATTEQTPVVIPGNNQLPYTLPFTLLN